MGEMLLVAALLAPFVGWVWLFGWVGSEIASARHRNTTLAAWVCILLGPVGVFIVYALPVVPARTGRGVGDA